MANLDLIRGRQVVIPLMNRMAGAAAAGDVVILDSANDESFVSTTTGRYLGTIGVVQEAIAVLGVGRVLIAGYAPLVNVNASVTRLNYMETHTVAKQAAGNATRRSGSCGQFLTSSATPSAVLWGSPDQS